MKRSSPPSDEVGPSVIVIDASIVLTSIFSPNVAVRKKLEIILRRTERGEVLLCAPELLWFEVANGLRFSERDQKITQKLYRLFARLPISRHPFPTKWLEAATALAYQYQTTVYDCAYHYLALELEGTFYTCDRKYFEKSKSAGRIKLIEG